jgi:hypothetical protein
VKKVVLLAMIVFTLAACDNNGTVVLRADSLKEGLDTTLDKIGDSAKAKGARTFETIKDKLENLGNKADSLNRDSAK